MLNFYQLQTFVTVISEGSMTGAADKLYLTQPAVSQQIRSLEEELGAELLVRGVRQIKPTLQGEILFEHARRVLQMVQQTEISVKAMGVQLKGTLRVGSLNSIGLHVMSGVFAKILKHNPELHFKLEYLNPKQLFEKFDAGHYDVIITPDTLTEYGISLNHADRRFLQKEEMWLVVSGKEVDSPKQIAISGLNRFPLIMFTGEYQSFNKSLMDALERNRVQIEPVFESSNVGTLKRVIETGLGWGFLPVHSIRKQVKMGRMQRVHVEGFFHMVDINFYAYQKSPNLKLVDIFYKALQTSDN